MRLQTAAAAALLPLAIAGSAYAVHQMRQRTQPVERITRVSQTRRIRREDSDEPEVMGWGGTDWHPTRDNPRFSLEIRFMSKRAAIEECARRGAWKDGRTPTREGGCALFYLDRDHCLVIVPEIEDTDDQATAVLGHEVAHCAKGRYHDE